VKRTSDTPIGACEQTISVYTVMQPTVRDVMAICICINGNCLKERRFRPKLDAQFRLRFRCT